MTPSADRPRLLFINRSYWPDVEATGQLLTELCEDLACDFDVHVLCGQPQRVVDDAEFAAAGRQSRNGVTIHRVRHTRFAKASFWGRLANMLSFQAAATWQALRAPRPDCVVTETDPPFLCLLGWLLKGARRCGLVCYLQDIYPDVAVALGKLRPGVKTRVLRRLFFAAYRRSDAVVVLSRDMRELVVEGGVSPAQVHVIANWVDTDAIYPVKENNRFRRANDLDGRFVVMYSGNMGLSQRLEQVLDAAELLRDRQDIVFAMVGDGAHRRNLVQAAADRKLANARFFDYQPKSELADSLSAADLHLVILRPEIKQLLMPSKLYGVLASGTPALVVADANCELAAIVAEHDLGTVVASEGAAELAEAVRRYAASRDLVERQSIVARKFAETHCRRSSSVGRFRALLGGLTAAKGASVTDFDAR
ncbi:MAG: glycosyltransferase family 4 protein [Pirellulales bacterium]|nr:glycosyltransferase family 4 protein [Pirellulales bacterium]